jgi:hypothetical protein
MSRDRRVIVSRRWVGRAVDRSIAHRAASLQYGYNMAITRVIATIPYFTAIPEDAATNTFYFASVAEPTSGDAATIADRLDAFYGTIDAYLSPVVSTTGGSYKFYKMSDPQPRTPFITLTMDPLTVGASGLAEEVAVCLSYNATPASGESPARRRGRIFIGPLATNAVTGGTTTAFSQTSVALRGALQVAAAQLADQSETFQWSVYSPTDLIARQIVGGYIDNSLDTQRRRGRRPTARTTWLGQP